MASSTLPISHIGTVDEYDRVTVNVPVKEPQVVAKEKTKQEIVIANHSGTTLLTLWENEIDQLTVHKSYQLNHMQLHKFLGKPELLFPRFGGSFHEREDVCH